jgi:hypothetical protein
MNMFIIEARQCELVEISFIFIRIDIYYEICIIF